MKDEYLKPKPREARMTHRCQKESDRVGCLKSIITVTADLPGQTSKLEMLPKRAFSMGRVLTRPKCARYLMHTKGVLRNDNGEKKRKIETIDQSVMTVEVPRSNTRASVSQAGRSSQVGGAT